MRKGKKRAPFNKALIETSHIHTQQEFVANAEVVIGEIMVLNGFLLPDCDALVSGWDMGMVLWNRCGGGDVGVARGLKLALLWGVVVGEGVAGGGRQWPEKAGFFEWVN